MMHPRTGLNKDKYVYMRPVGPVQLDGGTTTKSKNMCTHASMQYENHILSFSQMDHQKFTTYQTLYENVQQSQDSFAISAGNKADI